jgi:hypothetical protein
MRLGDECSIGIDQIQHAFDDRVQILDGRGSSPPSLRALGRARAALRRQKRVDEAPAIYL